MSGRYSRQMVNAWGMTMLVVLVVASAIVAVALEPPSAPYSSNGDCLTCHASAESVSWPTLPKEDFSAEPVDRLTACWKCHWRAAGSHPHTTMGCGCHVSPRPSTWGSSWPKVETSSGWFHTAESANADAETLHRVHMWPDGNASLYMYNVKCGSCHARAACSACHGSTSHSVHPYALEPGAGGLQPWTGTVAVGTPVGDKYADGRRTEVVTCDIPGCHPSLDLPQAQIKKRRIWELNPSLYAAYGPVTRTGTPWGVWAGGYGGWGADWTRAKDASMSTTFTGSRISIRSLRDPRIGAMCDIYLDGVKVDTITAYAPVAPVFATVWESPTLEEREHTLTIVHTGIMFPAATDNVMLIDVFEVYSSAGPFVYECTVCHEEMARQHTP